MENRYLKRNIDKELAAWKNSDTRKPLLLRGARQVGKSSTVRELAKQFDYFIEINFELDDKELDINKIFDKGLSPQRISEELSVIYNTPIIAGRTLLFFDEIQICLPAISSMRYFYEKMPEIHLIAAGSLLEFALQELPSFGVGRVRSLFMFPFSFPEFLEAMGVFNHVQIKESVNLLELAGIIHPVTHTAANGIPLAAEQKTKFRKYLILDTGIYQRFLQLDISQILIGNSLEQINKSAIADLFVGLELLKASPVNNPVQLFYWQREQAGANAEVDYVIQKGSDILPLEVKAGTKGAMQSMFVFLNEKKNHLTESVVHWKISGYCPK